MPRLYVDKIDSVGLVDEGDNPAAKVSFWKRRPKDSGVEPAENSPVERADNDTEVRYMGYDLTGLEDSVREAVEKDLARLADFDAAVTPEPEPDPDPAVAEAVAKRDEEIAKLRADLDAERLEKRQAEFVTKAGEYPAFTDETETAAGHLLTLTDADADAVAYLLGKLEALQKIADESKLFEEVGSEDAGDVSAQIAALAKDKQKDNPDLSDAQARWLVRKERPDLKTAEREES